MDTGEYERLSAELESLEPDDTPIARLFEYTRAYLIRRLRLRRVAGTPEFWDPHLYGQPAEDLIALAERILTERQLEQDEEKEIHGPGQLAALMEQALRRYGLEEWKVAVQPNITATNVDSPNRVINVRGDLRYSVTMAKRLIVHEIETHVLRA